MNTDLTMNPDLLALEDMHAEYLRRGALRPVVCNGIAVVEYPWTAVYVPLAEVGSINDGGVVVETVPYGIGLRYPYREPRWITADDIPTVLRIGRANMPEAWTLRDAQVAFRTATRIWSKIGDVSDAAGTAVYEEASMVALRAFLLLPPDDRMKLWNRLRRVNEPRGIEYKIEGWLRYDWMRANLTPEERGEVTR